MSAFDALAFIEIASIARGYVTLDRLVKKASVAVRFARPVTPGKFIILFSGDLANVEESFLEAEESAQSTLLDSLLLPFAHPKLLPAIEAKVGRSAGESLAVVELTHLASTLLAADLALKTSATSLMKMHLAIGIGGKGYFTLSGPLGDIEVAIDALVERIPPERIVACEVIPNPHRETRGFFS